MESDSTPQIIRLILQESDTVRCSQNSMGLCWIYIYTPDILWISLLSSFFTLFYAYNWLKIMKSIVPNKDQCRRASVLVKVSDFSEFYNDFQWFLMTSDSLGICFINSAIIHILNVLWWCQMISNKRNQFVPRCYTIQNGHSMNICNRDLP